MDFLQFLVIFVVFVYAGLEERTRVLLPRQFCSFDVIGVFQNDLQ